MASQKSCDNCSALMTLEDIQFLKKSHSLKIGKLPLVHMGFVRSDTQHDVCKSCVGKEVANLFNPPQTKKPRR